MDYTNHELYAASITTVLRDLTTSLQVHKVLDFGCGDGLLTHFFSQALVASCTFVGIDYDPDKIRHAQELYPHIQWECIQEPRFAWPEATFDLVYAVNVFHHIADVQRSTYMHELMRVLRPGGVGIFIEHNPASKKAQQQFCQEHQASMQMISPKDLKALCKPYGTLSCSYHLTDWPGWLEPYVAWLPCGQVYAIVVRRVF